MDKQPILKKVSIPKNTEPKEFYYDESRGVMVFEAKKKARKNEHTK